MKANIEEEIENSTEILKKLDSKILDIIGEKRYNYRYGLMFKFWHYNHQSYIIKYFAAQALRC